MGLAILVIVVIAIIIAVMMMSSKNKKGAHDSGSYEIKDLNVTSEKKVRKGTYSKEDESKAKALEAERAAQEREKELAFFAAKKSMYQYFNQSMKTMNHAYQKDAWMELTAYAGPSADMMEAFDQILSSLSKTGSGIVKRYMEVVSIEKDEAGYKTVVKDAKGLKAFYLDQMLPFYELYAPVLDQELRYNALLGKDILYLFHELTGKKFRMGYKNKYNSGVAAYEFDKETQHYKVYAPNAKLLCDATFANHKVKDGYAIVPVYEKMEEFWDVVYDGIWKDGQLEKGILGYNYKKICG